jgi:V8-like Glu-specific endopeptidase
MKRLFAILLLCVLAPCASGETINYDNGDRYVGDVSNGVFHGYGTYTFGKGQWEGDKYVGQYKNGKKHGHGTYTYANGEKYIGEYRDELKSGQGTETFLDGSKYVGEFKDDKKHGQGTYTAANGFKYVGEFKDNRQEGYGTYIYPDGTKFVGEWENVSMSGQGTHTSPDGTKFVGEWKNRKRWNGTQYKADRTIEGTFSNGKWCPGCKPQVPTTPRIKSSGTGFAVNKNYIVTAYHVIDECRKVTIRHSHENYQAKVVASDASNDLGLLRLGQSISDTAKLRGGKQVRLGDRIATYGYPLFGKLSDSAKITQGNINSLAGMKNNSSRFQYDAPTQRGNSGGPVLDFSGNVVGVVVSGLDDAITQTINFAVKSYLVEGFLSSNNVPFQTADSTEKLELPDIAEKAERFTVLVGCWE